MIDPGEIIDKVIPWFLLVCMLAIIAFIAILMIALVWEFFISCL